MILIIMILILIMIIMVVMVIMIVTNYTEPFKEPFRSPDLKGPVAQQRCRKTSQHRVGGSGEGRRSHDRFGALPRFGV